MRNTFDTGRWARRFNLGKVNMRKKLEVGLHL